MAMVVAALARALQYPTADRKLIASTNLVLAVSCLNAGNAHLAAACASGDADTVWYAIHMVSVGILHGSLCLSKLPGMGEFHPDVLAAMGATNEQARAYVDLMAQESMCSLAKLFRGDGEAALIRTTTALTPPDRARCAPALCVLHSILLFVRRPDVRDEPGCL